MPPATELQFCVRGSPFLSLGDPFLPRDDEFFDEAWPPLVGGGTVLVEGLAVVPEGWTVVAPGRPALREGWLCPLTVDATRFPLELSGSR